MFSSPREHDRFPKSERSSDPDGDKSPAKSGDESPHFIALQGPAGRTNYFDRCILKLAVWALGASAFQSGRLVLVGVCGAMSESCST